MVSGGWDIDSVEDMDRWMQRFVRVAHRGIWATPLVPLLMVSVALCTLCTLCTLCATCCSPSVIEVLRPKC